MSPSRPFILRPVATSLLMVAILLAGAVAYLQLPVSALPQVDYPIIQVQTFYPGASPEVMVSSVTAPLERQFGQIPGLKQMTSTSSGGASIITLEFSLNESIDIAQQDVQAAINAGFTFLPKRPPQPARLQQGQPGRRADHDACPHQQIPLRSPRSKTSPTPSSRRRSRSSPASASSPSPAARSPRSASRPTPPQLAGYGLSLEDVRTALGTANVDQAKGSTSTARARLTPSAPTTSCSPAPTTPTSSSPTATAPRSVSRTSPTPSTRAENLFQAAWMGTAATPARQPADGTATPAAQDAVLKPAVILNIQRQPGANIIGVVDEVRSCCRSSAPPCRPASTSRSSPTAPTPSAPRSSRRPVRAHAHHRPRRHGDLPLPALVSRATIIPAVAVPLSIVGTFGVMYLLGYSLNNLSLMALTISTGFVVDDAIVMIENISRYLEEGDSPARRRAQGLRADRLHHPLAHRLADRRAHPAALHGRHRRPPLPRVRRHPRRHHPGLGRRLAHLDPDDGRQAAQAHARTASRPPSTANPKSSSIRHRRFTAPACASSCDHQVITLLVTLATFILTVYLYIIVPKGFFPVQDTGVLLAITEGPSPSAFAAMADRVSRSSPTSSSRTPMSKASPPSSASTAPTPRSTAAASRST